jgi:hypothetical protein
MREGRKDSWDMGGRRRREDTRHFPSPLDYGRRMPNGKEEEEGKSHREHEKGKGEVH